MSKYGLRAFSGPFDWLVTSNFDWVLHYIETGFKDFLQSENLETFENNPNHFRDKQSGFLFVHDTENFEMEYDKLKAKYDKRIDNFLKKIKSRVCYFRSLRNSDQVKYVENNASYIKYIIQKYNCDSEIIFLCSDNLVFYNNLGGVSALYNARHMERRIKI